MAITGGSGADLSGRVKLDGSREGYPFMHCTLAAISTSLTLAVMIVTAASGAAPLFNQRIPVESIAGNQPEDGVVGHFLQTIGGWKEITGYVFHGDGIRHSVRGKCLENGSVLLLEDDLPECGTEQQCAQITPSP